MIAQRIPSYRLHASSGQAVVTLNGNDIYLGAHNSPDSRSRYDRAIAEWLSAGRKQSQQSADGSQTVNDVILSYYTWALNDYRAADGALSREPEAMKLAFRRLKHLYGDTSAESFGPLKLQAVRRFMTERNLVRSLINRRIRYIQRMFLRKHSVLLPASFGNSINEPNTRTNPVDRNRGL